jgi:hypothetical protein
MKIDKQIVPRELQMYIDYAEKWGIGDDFDRGNKVKNSADSDLEKLIKIGDELAENETFNDWLYGSESNSLNPSKEYIAFTNLTMAIDSARDEWKKRKL